MIDPRIIPSIEELRQRPAVRQLESRYGHDQIVAALRAGADELRRRLIVDARTSDNVPQDPEAAARAIESAVLSRVTRAFEPSLRPVLNATGVIVHTNLGRAPLPPSAIERLGALGGGYSNLEYDLERGERGRRDLHAESLLGRVTGAEAAVVVNNNAAATLLLLAAVAAGREVLISRGELVEIGGGFRVPDVMAQSGAVLREVGTTNKTRAADYAAAIGERTGLILKVHRSNFRIEGFTEQASLPELVALGRQFNVPVAEDLGSGNLVRPEAASVPAVLKAEPDVRSALDAGADLICFSGDKLLGGPQAGIILGRRDLIDRIRRHPLMRVLRVDKLTYAALEATLFEYAAGRAFESVPVLRMIAASVDAIDLRARRLVDRLHPLGAALGARISVIDGESTVGGGSAPGSEIPTRLVSIQSSEGAGSLETRLRSLDPPVIARIVEDRVVLDLRTIPREQDELLATTLLQLVG
ncbi:MAG: L-seryl-tRNA(Sec) selenium transferase [Acidobacteria bacterium]|nr:L-seryl-tRNA(Sec) selenium transferase [Acidobacteriota bacterium]